jgi:hypothetical protein
MNAMQGTPKATANVDRCLLAGRALIEMVLEYHLV